MYTTHCIKGSSTTSIKLKDILHKNNLTIVTADKNKAMAIIQTDVLEQKINNFIQGNHITLLKKDPTETFQNEHKNTTGSSNM